MENCVYDAKFSGNLLIAGRTGCGKTYFTEKLAINRFFGYLKKVKWVLYIELKPEREAEIESCFSCDVEFHYPKGLEKFGDLLDDFKARSNTAKAVDTFSEDNDIVNIGFGEKTNRDRLIVMYDVSGLADESKELASFLTVACKFNYTCVYIFHTIYREKSIRRAILLQTNIVNIFPASVSLTSVPKICLLANRDDRVCLTLDSSGVNKDGPGRSRTEGDKPDFQTCYFNLANDEQAYNEFVSKQINENESNDRIQFKIIHLKSKTNREEKFDGMEELQDLTKNNAQQQMEARKKELEQSLAQVENHQQFFFTSSLVFSGKIFTIV